MGANVAINWYEDEKKAMQIKTLEEKVNSLEKTNKAERDESEKKIKEKEEEVEAEKQEVMKKEQEVINVEKDETNHSEPSNGLENFGLQEEGSLELFEDSNETQNNLSEEEKDIEEDELEIPAFLRRQKN